MSRLGISFESIVGQLANRAGTAINPVADSRYLEALEHIAENRQEAAEIIFADIALNFKDYEPGSQFAQDDGRPYIGDEITEFRQRNPRFDFGAARQRLDTHQAKYRKGQTRNF